MLEGKITEDEYHEAMGTLHSTLDPMFARGLVMKAAKELYNERPAAEKMQRRRNGRRTDSDEYGAGICNRSQLMILKKKRSINW